MARDECVGNSSGKPCTEFWPLPYSADSKPRCAACGQPESAHPQPSAQPAERECPDCDGTGRRTEDSPRVGPGVVAAVLVTSECPTCHGTGKVPAEREELDVEVDVGPVDIPAKVIAVYDMIPAGEHAALKERIQRLEATVAQLVEALKVVREKNENLWADEVVPWRAEEYLAIDTAIKDLLGPMGELDPEAERIREAAMQPEEE